MGHGNFIIIKWPNGISFCTLNKGFPTIMSMRRFYKLITKVCEQEHVCLFTLTNWHLPQMIDGVPLVKRLEFGYGYLFTESLRISQQVSAVLLFLSSFYLLQLQIISGRLLIYAAMFSVLAGYMLLLCSCNSMMMGIDFKSTLLLVTILMGLSPLLKTLTQDISEDTIWALTTILFFVNLVFHDYSQAVNNTTSRGSLSLNAAIFASVLLASRLNSNEAVFAVLLNSVVIFGLLPLFFRHYRTCSPNFTTCLHMVVIILNLFVVTMISELLYRACLVIFVIISIMCPILLRHLQRQITIYWIILIRELLDLFKFNGIRLPVTFPKVHHLHTQSSHMFSISIGDTLETK